MDAAATAPPIAIELASERPFRVGRANIDPVSREATFDGQSERLQPQNLKVLVALARHRSKVVTRDLLVDLCWDGRIVGDDVINRAVSNLRQFAERAGGFSIETVPRAGYRLVEPLPPGRSRLWLIGAVAAITLAIAGTAFLQWPRHDNDRQMPTIAILPFTAASGDAQERELAADARDAIAQSLSATEYQVRLSDGSPRARHTADDFVVSGDVSANPQKMVVTVRVEDTVHDAIVYSNRFETERGEAGNLPDQVGAQIAGSLGWAASLLRLDRTHPSDPAITAELFRQSADYQTARQIAAKAPNSVIAQIVLAYTATDVLPDLPFDQRAEAAAAGRRALDRARLLAPRFGDTETMWCLLHSHARFIECEDHLRAGMRRDPASSALPSWLANELKDVGRTNEAMQLAISSLRHNPYLPDNIGLELRMAEALGRHDEADDLYRDARRAWPDDGVIFWDRVYGMLDRGNFEGLEAFKKEVSPVEARSLEPVMPVIAALKGNDSAAVRRLCPPDETPGFKTDLCMLALARIGDNDDAFALAWRIYPNRIGRTQAEEDKLWLESGRYFDSDILMGSAAASLRADPRYLELVRRLGVLVYWRSGRFADFCRVRQPEPVCKWLTPQRR